MKERFEYIFQAKFVIIKMRDMLYENIFFFHLLDLTFLQLISFLALYIFRFSKNRTKTYKGVKGLILKGILKKLEG